MMVFIKINYYKSTLIIHILFINQFKDDGNDDGDEED